LNVAMSSSGRTFHPTEIPFFHELARRIGQAVASAEIFERERRAAREFQAAALPSHLPTVAGMRFETLYEAAQSEAAVGGDWYDVFRLPDGRIVLSIGDVCGSGLHAAVAMASVRQSIRTAALINPDPAAVLSAVDRIVRAMDDALFVTAFAAVIDPVWFVMLFASAGHPPPLLRGPDGSIKTLRDPDLPLGLRERGEHAAARIAIAPGSMLVAYTDGLTEFDRDPIEGEQVVARALREAGMHDVPRELFNAAARGRAAHDDIAILAVAFDCKLMDIDGPMRAAHWEIDARDAVAAGAIRRDFVQRLTAAGLEENDVASAELVLVELLANVVRYTPGKARVVLDISGHAPVVQVADDGKGFEFKPRLPADVMSECGRGLFLISALSNEFSVERRRLGGSRARAVLCGRVRRPARAADVSAGSGPATPATSP
ncbi:MAG: serine/threonine-protein phosphatase, partial [Candidatus Eremiobacteraeota bacterium]|nr:serine/threonine-protein phosphatase [Candidatus Eremiobacteraeota bacterium]